MLLKEKRQKNEKIEKENTKANKLANAFLEKVKRYNEELARKEKIENEIKALQARAAKVAQDIINLPIVGEKNKTDSLKKETKGITKKTVVPEPLVHIKKESKNKSTEIFSHTFIAPEYELDKDEVTPSDISNAEINTPTEPEAVIPVEKEETAVVSESVITNDIDKPERVLNESASVVAGEASDVVVPPSIISVPAGSPVSENAITSGQSTSGSVENVTSEAYYEESVDTEVTPVFVEPIIEKSQTIEEIPQPKTETVVEEELVKPVTPAPVEKTVTNETALNLAENKKKVDQVIENLVDELSPKEIKVIEEEMSKESPLVGISPEIKKDKKRYLINQIVKYFSGVKLPAKVRRIVLTSALPLLTGVAVFTYKSLDSNQPNNFLEKKNKLNSNIPSPVGDTTRFSDSTVRQPEAMQQMMSSIDLLHKADSIKNVPPVPTLDSATMNSLEPLTQQVYRWVRVQGVDTFFFGEKKTASFISIGKGGVSRGSAPAIFGQSFGETPNTVNLEQEIHPFGSMTTPAGVHYIKAGVLNDQVQQEYKGRVVGLVDAPPLSIHTTYAGEYAVRTKALNSPSPLDNRMSWGCINLSAEDFDRLIGSQIPYQTVINGQIHEGALFIIMPDNPELYNFNEQTGRFELKNREVIVKHSKATKDYFSATSSTLNSRNPNDSEPL